MKGMLCSVAGLAQLLIASAASAQADVPASADPVAEDEQAPAAGNEEIIVTANRREERLQEVPISVTALSPQVLERSGITNTFQLSQSVPGLTVTRANSAVQPTLRGIGTRSAAPGDESNVAVYLDGVYQPSMAAGAFNLLNVERVEVLRGPQGTLFGRNSTGGLINVITTDPGRDFEARAVASYGSFDTRSVQGYVSVPLGPTLAANLTALWGRSDGYLRDFSRGGRRVSPSEDFAIRGKLLFEPTDDLSFKLTLARFESRAPTFLNITPYRGNTSARSLANNPSVTLPTGPYQVQPTVEPDQNLRQNSAAFEARFDLGFASLQSTSSYQRTIAGGTVDSDGTPVNLGFASSTETERSRYYTQELRLLSTGGGPFRWILGGFYFNGRGGFRPINSVTPAARVQIFSDQRTESFAGFAEGTYNFTPELSLTAGARFTTEQRTYNGETLRNGALLVAGGVPQRVVDQRLDFDKVTYRAALRYEFSDQLNVYGSYSRGFKSGVFNSFSTNPLAPPTSPEILDSYEIGLKADPAPWLRINLAAFHYDYQNIQLSAFDATTNLVVLLNAASARVNGAEFELTVSPTRNFRLRAFGTLLDAKYSDFPNAQIFTPILQDQTAIGGSATTPIGNAQSITDESGRQMLRAPKFTFGVSGDYEIETSIGDFNLSGSVYRTSRFYWDVNNRLSQPAYFLVNSELSWTSQDGHFGASLWVRNLTQAVIFQSLVGNANGDFATFDRPRSFGGTLRVNF